MRADGRTELGRFAKTLPIWDGSDWDAGWIDNRGRFRVYRPDYPRAYSGGYALRAHIVWWLAGGEVHPEGTNLHHVDGDRLNDKLENLELLDHGEHSRITNGMAPLEFTCIYCGKSFLVSKHRERIRKFCSYACFAKAPRTEEHKAAISRGLIRFRRAEEAA